jgi:CheY-like chemotaxis protein
MDTSQTNSLVVLVIEDEKPLQDAIKAKLQKNNFSVVTARTAVQALGYLEDIKKIDVVWLDHYLLGEENGLDIVVKMKANPNWKNIPVFVVSNTAGPDKVKAYIGLGINKYCVKSDKHLDDIILDIRKALKIA